MNLECPYCYEESELVRSTEVLTDHHGWIYLCRPCQAWIGCHKGSTKPYGRLANAELRDLKDEAHEVFDKIWKKGGMERNQAYAWLAMKMQVPRKYCHIGMFSEGMCREVIKFSKEFFKET